MIAKIKFNTDGKCVQCCLDGDDSFEQIEVNSLNCDENHREPYLTQYKLIKIREKQKEIIRNYSYIPGLSVGILKDEEWTSWIESVISFTDNYKNLSVIEDSEIRFPEDPDGLVEKITF
jgi:hypothetical protein